MKVRLSPHQRSLLPAYVDPQLLEELFLAGFPRTKCKSAAGNGVASVRWPSSDDLAHSLEKIVPYIKIRRLPVGYFAARGPQDAQADGLPERKALPLPSKQWGAALAEGSDYGWQPTLWSALAEAYLRAEDPERIPSSAD